MHNARTSLHTLARELAALVAANEHGPLKLQAREIARHVTESDPVSLSLLTTYARCLNLTDDRARWSAQMQFHRAQIAREGGGTMGHKLGGQLECFLREQEGDDRRNRT